MTLAELPEAERALVQPSSLEDDAVVEYLSHPAEFPIRQRLFREKLAAARPNGWHGKLWWGEARTGGPSVVGGAPGAWDALPEARAYVQEVPVTHAPDAIAAFPNGYFGGDLSPFENHQLASVLEAELGLTIVGLGAAYAGFSRTERLNAEDAERFEDLLRPLYHADRAPASGEIARLVRGERDVFVNYNE